MDEMLDVFDEAGNKVGTATKSEAHRMGLLHQCAHIWVYNSRGELLLQRRSWRKKSHPGLWDISAAGHIDAGETPQQGAARELYEELGLKGTLEKVGVHRETYDDPRINWHNREIDHIFLLRFDGKLAELKLQEEEVEEVAFIPLADLEAELADTQKSGAYVNHGLYWLKVIALIREKEKSLKPA